MINDLDRMMATIKSICPRASIQFRSACLPGVSRWYLSTLGLELAVDGMLAGIRGDGESPQEAVQVAYSAITDESAILKRNRTYHRWNGFMFEQVNRPTSKEATDV